MRGRSGFFSKTETKILNSESAPQDRNQSHLEKFYKLKSTWEPAWKKCCSLDFYIYLVKSEIEDILPKSNKTLDVCLILSYRENLLQLVRLSCIRFCVFRVFYLSFIRFCVHRVNWNTLACSCTNKEIPRDLLYLLLIVGLSNACIIDSYVLYRYAFVIRN